MQKKLIALAVAGLVSGAAFAQSNVTIYGIADVGVEYGNAGNGSKFRVQSGQAAGSRLGFKGEEALGNGLKALFTLEMGINIDAGTPSGNGAFTAAGSNNGTSSTIFQRQAFAGLSSDVAGTVTIGRQYSPAFYIRAKSDIMGIGQANTSTNVMNGVPAVGAIDRFNNSIIYATPNFAGFNASVAFSSGEENQVDNPGEKNGRAWAAGAQYGNGPVWAGLAYVDGKLGANTSPTGAGGAGVEPGKTKGWILGGSYDLKVVKLAASYSAGHTDNTAGTRVADLNAWTLGASMPFGAHLVSLTYGDRNDKLTTDADFKQWGLGYNYALSKRTDLYASYAKGTNKNAGTQAINNALAQGLTTVAGYDPYAVTAGIRHSF